MHFVRMRETRVWRSQRLRLHLLRSPKIRYSYCPSIVYSNLADGDTRIMIHPMKMLLDKVGETSGNGVRQQSFPTPSLIQRLSKNARRRSLPLSLITSPNLPGLLGLPNRAKSRIKQQLHPRKARAELREENYSCSSRWSTAPWSKNLSWPHGMSGTSASLSHKI